MFGNYVLDVPELGLRLYEGCRVKLGRFDADMWILQHGWYSWGGNRPFCGWFLTNAENPNIIKPLQRPDLDDVYLVER